jgi:hypothetical protein
MITSEPTIRGWAYTRPSTDLVHDFLTFFGDGEVIETPLRAAMRPKVGQFSCAAVGCEMPFTGRAVTVPEDVHATAPTVIATTRILSQPRRRFTRL